MGVAGGFALLHSPCGVYSTLALKGLNIALHDAQEKNCTVGAYLYAFIFDCGKKGIKKDSMDIQANFSSSNSSAHKRSKVARSSQRKYFMT